MIRDLYIWLDLPLLGALRYTTILTAALLIVAIAWRTRNLWFACLTVLAWASAYEIVYGWTSVIINGWDVNQTTWMSAAVLGWVLLAHIKNVGPEKRLLLVFSVLWVVWIVLGFYSNAPTNSFDPASEVMNVATKSMMALSYLAGALRSASKR